MQLRKRGRVHKCPTLMFLPCEYCVVVPRFRWSFIVKSWNHFKDLRGELIHKWRNYNGETI